MAEGVAERHMRSLLEAENRRILKEGGCAEARREKLAKFKASIRSTEELNQKQKLTIKRFKLPVTANAVQFLKFQMDRLKHYEDLRSFDIEGVTVVTPPTDVMTYHIIDTTRPSEENPDVPDKDVSIMQTLVRQNDNYVVGLRPTPENPLDPDGFFLFNDKDIEVPSFLGKCHRLSCSSNYKFTGGIRVCDGILDTIVECLGEINEDTCKHITKDTRQMIETKMVVFGECIRLHVALAYVIDNCSSCSAIHLPEEVLTYMQNWGYLSKAIFRFYLGMLELALGVVDAEDTFVRGRRSLAAAVKKFKEMGFSLDIKGASGFFSLRKLAGNCVRLLKYDEVLIKKLIMRKELQYTARFKLVNPPREEMQKEDEKLRLVADKKEEAKELEYARGLLRANRVIKVLLDLRDVDRPWRGCYPNLQAQHPELQAQYQAQHPELQAQNPDPPAQHPDQQAQNPDPQAQHPDLQAQHPDLQAQLV